MKNADVIRSFTDEQLSNFLWTWKINAIMNFLENGGQRGMNAKELHDWLKQKDGFVCDDTHVNEDFVFNQDFLEKKIYAESKPFSNGTEYEIFLDNYCNKCERGKLREDGFPEFPDKGGCPIWDKMENARLNIEEFPANDILEVKDRGGNVLSWHHCCSFIDKEDE